MLSAEFDAVMEVFDTCTSYMAVELVQLRNWVFNVINVIFADVNSHIWLVTIH